MNLSKVKIVGSLLGASVSLFISALCASAVYLNYEIHFEQYQTQQLMTNWCWAASAEATGRYACQTSTKTQVDAVNYIYGASVNYSADVSQTAQAASYIANNTVTYSGYNYPAVSEQIVQKIMQDRVSILGYRTVDSDGIPVPYSGHMTTVTRFETYTNVNQKNIYLYDPGIDTVVLYNFNSLYQGTLPTGSGYYLKSSAKVDY